MAFRMQGKVIGILETRTGAHLAELIARRGGIPLLAPALAELPDVDPALVAELIAHWPAEPFKMIIFQTGVGTRALFQATDAAGLTGELKRLLDSSIVVVRGPKPVAELNARQVRIDVRAASPFTTERVLEAVSTIEVSAVRVLVQRYGAENHLLRETLEARGATVREIATYRWALPADTQPLHALLDALAAARIDAMIFTSAVQIHNLYQVAEQAGRAADLAGQLNGLFIASIGPVCSRALREHGVEPSFEADPPKLGPLIAGLDAALTSVRL